MIEKFLQGGTIIQVLGVAGALGVLLAVAALLVIFTDGRSTLLRGLAILCLISADVAAGAGVFGSWSARQQVEEAAAKMRPAKAERARYEGYIAAGSPSGLAVPMTGFALVLAAIALQVAGRRRWTEEHDSPPLGPALPGLLLLGGFALCGVAIYFWQGHRLSRPMDDSAWRVLDLRDALEANEWAACLSTDLKLDATSIANDMKELRKAQSDCAKHLVAASMEKGSGKGDLEKLLAQKWFEGGEVRRIVQERLDEMVVAENKIAKLAAIDQQKPAPPPDPAIARVHDAALGCYTKGGKPGHKPSVPPSMHVIVSKPGKIVDAKRTDGAQESPRTMKCIAKALKDISFLAGDERNVDIRL